MVQLLPQAPPKGKSFAQKLSQGVGTGLSMGQQMMQESAQKKALKDAGLDANLPPELQKIALSEKLKGKAKSDETAAALVANKKAVEGIEAQRNLPKGSLAAFEDDPKLAEQVSRPAKEKEPPLTAKPVPKEISSKIKQVLDENKNVSADELRLAMDEAEIPPAYSNSYTENRRRTEEQLAKSGEEYRKAMRHETLPIRTKLAEKADAALKGIQNKEQLMDLIEKGNLDDPTFAALAEALPLNLGKRLLSNDTTEYKAGLVEEFGDLRNIFQGQTRIKEIELLENKIADIYLTDDQKKAVLRSRINALKADVIRAEAAAELENRDDLGVLQFNKEVENKSKPKLDALFNQILDEQKAIIQNAENKKNVPLDKNDPEDKKIMQQIMKEANGDPKEALKLAKQKGYKFS